MKVSVIGCGRWGSFIAWYLNTVSHQVTLYGRKGSKNLLELMQTGKNQYVTLNQNIKLTDDLDTALASDYIFISISAQGLRGFLEGLKDKNIQNKAFILCMKGLEQQSGKRLTEVFSSVLPEADRVAVWVGPGHIQDFTAGVPNCMVIDTANRPFQKELVALLESKLIRFYYGTDLLGNELGAAAKNVYGLAAGMLDGVGYTSLKGGLIVRACVEMARLCAAMGGDPQTVYGLGFLGEIETTFFSTHSNNRLFGENFIKGIATEKLCEGVYTLLALHNLAEQLKVDMPICNALYQILHKGSDPMEEFENLLLRPLKKEF